MSLESQVNTAKNLMRLSGRVSSIGLISLGGSHAYGLATETSDIDIRGFAFPTVTDILLGRDFEQIGNMSDIDMCIYSLTKTCRLMAQCNPNMIELLGLTDDAIVSSSDEYVTMRSHPEWFLSRRAAYTFGGYATSQLRRIQNAMARDTDAKQLAKGEIRSLEATIASMPDSYPSLRGRVKMFLKDESKDSDNIRINIDVDAKDVPITELAAFARQLDSARKSAETIGKNRRRESKKLAKHASHLIRLLHMGAEILRGEGVKTRRTEDANLLLDIKNGMWLNEDELGHRTYADEFWQLLDESERDFENAKANTALPSEPKLDELQDFIATCHKKVITESKTC